jgi:hypothetical protein
MPASGTSDVAGQHLSQIVTGVIGLKATINAALTAAGVSPLVEMLASPVDTTKRRRLPLAVVSLGTDRRRDLSAVGGDGSSTVEIVRVSVTVECEGGETAGLIYEGVIAVALRAARAAMASVVTDASLHMWRLSDSGQAGPDPEVSNRDGWRFEIVVDAVIEY